MLLRVDVYPNTLSIDAASTELPAPVQSLLVSLNTASSSKIVTVGRKDALITFGADKSVSRQHMTLELVSSRKFEPLDGKPLPRSPQGTAEMDACETNDMICVLKDTSKFGTYSVAPGDHDDAKTKNNDDDTTADDETDDEGHAVSQPNPSQLSSVATKLINPSGAKLVKIEDLLVLSNLCKPHGQVIIQVGQNGSTLVIQRVPYRMALSRVSAKIKDLWSSRCYLVGVTLLESLDESMTHLVTVDRITNAKSLTAWCLSKPLVTVEFLEALWNRKRPTDPLPDATNYETQEPKDGLTFWKERPNPKLWSHTTMLSFDPKSDDMEALCRAAGATIIQLNRQENPLQAIHEALTKGGCFYLQSNSRSHTKILKHLKSLNVQAVTQKSIALYVSRQEPLQDTNLVDIGSPDVAGSVNEHTLGEVLPSPKTTKISEVLKSPPVRKSREKEAPTDEEDYGDNELPTRSRRSLRQTSSREELLVEEPSQPHQTLPTEDDDIDDELRTTFSRSQRRVSQQAFSKETAQSQKSRTLPTLDDNDEEDDCDEEPPKIVSRLGRASRQMKTLYKDESDDAGEKPPKIISRSQRTSHATKTPKKDENENADLAPNTLSRSQQASPEKKAPSEDEEELPKTVSRSQRALRGKITQSNDEDHNKRPVTSSRSQQASGVAKTSITDDNDVSDEELPKIGSRSQRASRVTKTSRKDESDSDDELPKIGSRSERANRVTNTPRNDESDKPDDEITKALTRSQRARGRQTLSKDEEDDGDEEKTLAHSQRAFHETKTPNKRNFVDEMHQASPVKSVDPSQTSQKRSLDDDAEDGNNHEVHVQASKRPKRSIGGWTDVRKVSRVGESLSNNDDVKNDDISVSDNDTGDQHRARKKPEFSSKMALQETNDGWLVAAPRDRTAFKATEAEILDSLTDAGEVPPTAETDVIDGLVSAIRSQPKSSNPAGGTVVDFRRFRKNSVIRGGEQLSRIQMRVVLPKASDRQAELEDEQAALEASLREADMLFQDRSGGGILGHFKASSRRRTREV